MRAADPRLEQLTDFLRAEGRPRVWSIIVTILGDVAEPLGGAIEMQRLLSICRALGIEEQAVRTATSRLQKEGFVVSARNGRRASYQFSPSARASYREAARLIYAPPVKPKAWAAALLPPLPQQVGVLRELDGTYPFLLGDAMAFWPEGSTFAGRARDKAGDRVLWLRYENVAMPDWANNAHAPKLNLTMCETIRSVAGRLEDEAPAPEHALAIRILLMHFWRRLVLRHPPIHAPLSDDAWPMSETQRALARAYPDLVESSAPALDAHGETFDRFR